MCICTQPSKICLWRKESFISVENLDKLLKLVDHLSWYWAVAYRILQLSITWENCCTISGAEWIASEAKNNHWVRDGIFSAKWKLISNNFSTSFQICNKRRRGKKRKWCLFQKRQHFMKSLWLFMVSDLGTSWISQFQWGYIM